MTESFHSFYTNEITSKGASYLFDTLRKCNSAVSILIISWNEIDDECLGSLGEYIRNDQHLEELSLMNNRITIEGVKIISESFVGNTSLKTLTLNGNRNVTDESVPYLIEMLKTTGINKLGVLSTSISKENVKLIFNTMQIPVEERAIPIVSNSKSAAKIS